jgi:hypothetical protein
MQTIASSAQQDAILGAMLAVASVHGEAAVTTADRATLLAAARIVFARPGVDLDAIRPISPASFGAAVAGSEAEEALRLVTVAALIDGSLDAAKVDAVVAYARAVGLTDAYIQDLADAAHGHLKEAMGHMIRENMESITGHPWSKGVTGDVGDFLLPYVGAKAEPALVARFDALGEMPPATFGRQFHDHFKANDYAFPGDPEGLNAVFSVPHDSCHVLAGYETTPGGEILTSTFTAGMHPKNSMAAHVLPVIMSWHLGIQFNAVAKSATGTLHPGSFLEAWQRGAATNIDLFAPGWDFWAATPVDIDVLRGRYGIPPREFPLDA